MQQFEIKPFFGMGPIKLGSAYTDVESVLGNPVSKVKRDEITQYHYKAFCIHFNDAGKVEFIAATLDPDYEISFLEIDPLRTPASEVIDRVSGFYQFDEDDWELGYSYIYQDIQVCFYRPTTPENDDDADGKFFDVVSVAEKGYW
ncbi:hypothetical protein [Shewanella sedimentimangrovi]|uniref:Uncharacterized protein n=1 Tax=Shewanella sedimentimangrovi TaxID=2814293 RepID=A0ABX7R215_9GAMM|nr:hypothetical protein [Shewanella sedimentimangrovi]QSX37861.1 hypothetical protein JYB85_03195 [Shewanella sedimentimangrovi]